MADQRYGPLTCLEIEGRTALLWPGYDLTLQQLDDLRERRRKRALLARLQLHAARLRAQR